MSELSTADEPQGITTGELEKLMAAFYDVDPSVAQGKFKFRLQQLKKLEIPSRKGLPSRKWQRHEMLGIVELIIAFDALNMGFTAQVSSDISRSTMHKICNNDHFKTPSDFFRHPRAMIIMQPAMVYTPVTSPVFESDNDETHVLLVAGDNDVSMMLENMDVAFTVFPLGKRVVRLKAIGEKTGIIPRARYEALMLGV